MTKSQQMSVSLGGQTARVCGALALFAGLIASCGDVTSDLIVRDLESDFSCLGDADCPTPQSRCDTSSGRCLECLERAHCAEGQICSLPAGTCVQGCNGGPPCPSAQPTCDAMTSLCRGCTDDGDCTEDERLCERDTGRCLQCFTNADCVGERNLCDPSGRCVECLSDGHCEEEQERCSSVLGECSVPCTANAGCEGDDPICDLAIGYCVECMEDGDCGAARTCRASECLRPP